MDIEQIRRRAKEIWEAEGKPDGEHERHWQQAERELSGDGQLPQTSSPAHHSSTTIPEGSAETSSDAVPSKGNKSGDFRPGELASENE